MTCRNAVWLAFAASAIGLCACVADVCGTRGCIFDVLFEAKMVVCVFTIGVVCSPTYLIIIFGGIDK